MARPPMTQNDPSIIEGELVESTERALSRSNNGDLDASVAVALSESEINTQIATARRFPRSMQVSIDRITFLATLDTETALECNYSLPRGRDENGKAKAITGPSIRFAELAAQQWGNNRVAARVVATDRKEKFIEAEGIYHDLETNSAVSARVRRRISGKNGQVYNDDMIVVTGNAAASIALRNAILRGIPRPVWRKAYKAVEQVIRGDIKTIGARRVDLLTRFKEELSISPAQVYAILGVKGENDIGPDEIVIAAGFYSALRNNEVTIDDLLRASTPPPSARSLGGAFGSGQQNVNPPAPAAPPAAPIHDQAPPETVDQQTGEVIEEDPAPEPDRPEEVSAAQPVEDDTFPGDRPSRPAEAAAPAPADVLAQTPQAEPSPALGAARIAWRAKADLAESYLTIKAAYNTLRKVPDFGLLSDADKRAEAAYGYAASKKLFDEKRDPASATNDPSVFSMFLSVGNASEIEDAWVSLVRSPAYRELKDGHKDALADAKALALEGK